MIELLPAIVMLVFIYSLTRFLNSREATQRQKAYDQRETERRNKVDALYGREK